MSKIIKLNEDTLRRLINEDEDPRLAQYIQLAQKNYNAYVSWKNMSNKNKQTAMNNFNVANAWKKNAKNWQQKSNQWQATATKWQNSYNALKNSQAKQNTQVQQPQQNAQTQQPQQQNTQTQQPQQQNTQTQQPQQQNAQTQQPQQQNNQAQTAESVVRRMNRLINYSLYEDVVPGNNEKKINQMHNQTAVPQNVDEPQNYQNPNNPNNAEAVQNQNIGANGNVDDVQQVDNEQKKADKIFGIMNGKQMSAKYGLEDITAINGNQPTEAHYRRYGRRIYEDMSAPTNMALGFANNNNAFGQTNAQTQQNGSNLKQDPTIQAAMNSKNGQDFLKNASKALDYIKQIVSKVPDKNISSMMHQLISSLESNNQNVAMSTKRQLKSLLSQKQGYEEIVKQLDIMMPGV